MKTIEIDKDIADELRDSDCEGWKHIETIRGDEHRWYFDMVTIVLDKKDDTYYGFEWLDDKSDMGDLDPFEYSDTDGKVIAKEYKPVTKVIVEYVPV